jgi:HEAT repeat protein
MLQVAQSLSEVSARDVGASSAAAARLNELAPTAAELTPLLCDANPFIRSGAAWWARNLSGVLPADLIDALRAAVYDRNAHVVQAALGTLGVLRLAAAANDVRDRLDDADPGVVHSAVFALGRIGPSEEGAHLLRFIGSPLAHLELAAVASLAHLRYAPAAGPIMARLEACQGGVRRARAHFELPRRCMNALVALQAREAVPLLVRIAHDEVGLRGMAVQALIDLRAEEAAPALLGMLNRLLGSVHEEKLCCSLLFLMTAVNYRFAMPDVRAFLAHRQPGVRCAALKAAARWRDREAAPAVRDLALQDPSAFVRPVATAALVELLGEQALPDLEALAGDTNSLVRAAVAEGLAGLPDVPPRGRALLVRLADDPAAPVARVASEALARLPEVAVSPSASARLTNLPAELADHAPSVRAFLRRWLGELRGRDGELGGAIQVVLRALPPADR